RKLLESQRKNRPIFPRLKKAFGLQADAQRAADEARQALESAEAIIYEWNRKITTLKELTEACERASQFISPFKSHAANCRAKIVDFIGSRQDTDRAVAHNQAASALEHEAVLPLLEEAYQTLCDRRKAHVAQMREYGRKNDVPADIIKKLSD